MLFCTEEGKGCPVLGMLAGGGSPCALFTQDLCSPAQRMLRESDLETHCAGLLHLLSLRTRRSHQEIPKPTGPRHPTSVHRTSDTALPSPPSPQNQQSLPSRIRQKSQALPASEHFASGDSSHPHHSTTACDRGSQLYCPWEIPMPRSHPQAITIWGWEQASTFLKDPPGNSNVQQSLKHSVKRWVPLCTLFR